MVVRKKPPRKVLAKRKKIPEPAPADFPIPSFKGTNEMLAMQAPTIFLELPMNAFFALWAWAEAHQHAYLRYKGAKWTTASIAAEAVEQMVKEMRRQFYTSSVGKDYFERMKEAAKNTPLMSNERQIGTHRANEFAALIEEEVQAALGGKRPKSWGTAAQDAQKPAERVSEGSRAKKARCLAEKKGVRCIGPAGHDPEKQPHKGKYKGRIVRWRG